jgi:hypothetical protein
MSLILTDFVGRFSSKLKASKSERFNDADQNPSAVDRDLIQADP